MMTLIALENNVDFEIDQYVLECECVFTTLYQAAEFKMTMYIYQPYLYTHTEYSQGCVQVHGNQ